MKIALNSFGGLFPRMDSDLLPAEGAQTALNVDLTTGKLVPIAVTGSLVSLNDGTNLIKNVPDAEFKQITKPAAPTVESRSYLFNPRTVECREYIFMRYMDPDDGGNLKDEKILNGFGLWPWQQSFKDYGVDLTWKKQNRTAVTLTNNILYQFRGPIYQFRVGGKLIPDKVEFHTETFPTEAIPLLDDDGEQYGTFQVADYNGPIFDDQSFFSDWETVEHYFDAHNATFKINMNYVQPRKRTIFYVQSTVDGSGDEGPPSEISEEITVLPGERITLNTISSGILYRSETGSDDFLKIADLSAVTFEDNVAIAENVPIPPYGNYPSGASNYGSVIHPAQFSAIFVGSTVYLSDYMRWWVYPDEYSVTFPSAVLALAVSGSSILVWTDTEANGALGKVWSLDGSNPAQLFKREVCADKPLLNKLSVCKVGGQLFYVSLDGLIAISAGDAQLATEPFYTRKEWSALTPASMRAQTNDESIYLSGGASNIRIDIKEQVRSITTYTATTGVSLTWKSRRYVSEKPWRPVCMRVRASSYPVTVKVYAMGSLVQTVTIGSADVTRLGRFRPERDWELQIESAYRVDEVEIASSMGDLRNG